MADDRNKQGALRQMRQSVDTGITEKRIDQGRGAFVGTGDFLNFYEDLGIASDHKTAMELRQGERDYQTEVGEYQGDIEAANRELGTLDSHWAAAQESFIPVNIMNGDQVEATYHLPREVAAQVYQGYDPHYYANMTDNALYIDVQTKEAGKRGQELHEGMIDTQNQVRDAWYDANRGAFEAGQQNIATAQMSLDEAKRLHDDQWTEARNQYRDRVRSMEALFTGGV